MKNQNLKTKETNSKGITLVALVISIIVLLILATVSINLIINNGILDKAKSAVDKYSEGEIGEQINLAYLEYEMARLTNTNLDVAAYMKQSLEKMYGKDTVNISKEDDVFHIEIICSNGNKKYYLNNGETGIYKDLEDYGVQIGDYIDYDCFTGVDNESLYYKSLSNINGSSDQEFQVTETDKIRKWKILGIDSTGKLLITTSDPIQTKTGSTYTLKGKSGYINGPDELNEISKIFGHGDYAISARSIEIDDINRIAGYSPTAQIKYTYTKKEDGYVYRNDVTNSNKTEFWYYIYNPYNDWVKLKIGDTSHSIINTKYSYSIIGNTKVNKMIRYNDDLTNTNYWLASRVEYCNENYVGFNLRHLSDGSINCNNYLYYSNGDSYSLSRGIRPVVILSPNINLMGSSEKGWTIN